MQISGKQAVLVVSFGTSYRQTRERTIGAIEARLAKAFPDCETARAFTSGMVIRSIEKKEGLHVENVEEAMERLIAKGAEQVRVVPTHLMQGLEYQKMLMTLRKFEKENVRILVGRPLLSTEQDLQDAAHVLKQIFGTAGFGKDADAVVLMGHGTEDDADRVYARLQRILRDDGCENLYIGTVEGAVTVQDVIDQMRKHAYRSVRIAPLMVVAGDHASNDLAGDEPDSWKNMLTREGYCVDALLKGLGEYPQIQELYVHHAEEAREISKITLL